VNVIVAAGTGLVLWYGAGLVLRGTLTSGALVVFLTYLSKLFDPLRDLSKMGDTVSKATVGLERIRAMLATTRGVIERPGARPAPPFRGLIEFDRVTFGYDPRHPVLRELSLRIEPGCTAAIVGSSGGGKSTLVSLIPRFYEPSAGVVRIDGQDVRELTLPTLRRQVGFVLQETVLFRAPVWQNIAYGRPEATREEIVQAAQLADAHEFISQMPDGYDTLVGERGVTLSGGERQRLGIARALLMNAPILILDEPTSALDLVSERLVLKALARLRAGRTAIVIAHRLGTIQQADVICVLHDGAIVEQGTHGELLARGGIYAQLYELHYREREALAGAILGSRVRSRADHQGGPGGD
jgi:ATP-binding cassette subfamily B protein